MWSFSDKERTDTSGYFFIPTPNDYTSAQLLNEYLAISGDTLSSFVRTRQWRNS
ncbi:MAG: hypothetical protein GXO48_08790 [Chlorobi bacterium]|nr:hypothetical protein [Chlorobiota bacterium]